MIIINNSLCDESYLIGIDRFIQHNTGNFINEENENYFNVFDNSKNINNSFLKYTEVDLHIKFLQTKFPEFLNKINLVDYDIKCVINKLIPGAFIQPHIDGTMYTHILYLNDDFTGGEIIFLGNKKPNKEKRVAIATIIPERNLSVFTSENYFHKVNPVITGERYTLTTFIREKIGYKSHNTKQFI